MQTWMEGAADIARFIHVGGASLALAAGAAALILRKGSASHRASGNLFFVSMLSMSAIGALMALRVPDPGSALGGAFTFYLTATGWAAARPVARGVSRFQVGAFLFGAAVAAASVIHGFLTEMSIGFVVATFAFAAAVAFAVACDFRVILRGGVTGTSRIARHLWRMCFALLFAIGAFSGNPKAQPEFLHGSPLLILPPLLILGATIYWQVRLRLPKGPLFALRGASSD